MPERTVLITGVSGEIGGYLAKQFLGAGWRVCGLDRIIPKETPQSDFVFEECDLADGPMVEEKIAGLHQGHGAFDAVINCAGLIANAPLISFMDGRLTHHSFDLWDRVISSCLSSAFHVTACTVPEMVTSRKKGVIVNISSICGRGNGGQTAYSAAKGGLNSLSLALAKELGPLGIRAVALAPGYFETASTRNNVTPTRLEEIANSVPLRRLGQLEEISSAVMFIVNNPYVNGTVIELDGGLTL